MKRPETETFLPKSGASGKKGISSHRGSGKDFIIQGMPMIESSELSVIRVLLE